MRMVLSDAVRAGTIIARNYVAQARVLAVSFMRHHPDVPFEILIIDGCEADRSVCHPVPVVMPEDLGLPAGEWEQMAGIYSVMEFATALKPAFLQHLLRRGGDDGSVALYLDPDILVFDAFPEVATGALESGMALTPHVLYPLPRDGLEPSEAIIMHSGLFNLGFVCVGSKGVDFLAWWHERARHDAVVDLANALFTDQRWVDWVPSLFQGHRPPSSRSQRGLLEPSRACSFSRFRWTPIGRHGTAQVLPLQRLRSGPSLVCQTRATRPRVRLSEYPRVAELCEQYSSLLRSAGVEEHQRQPYRLSAAR